MGVKAPGRPTRMIDLLDTWLAKSTFLGGKPE